MTQEKTPKGKNIDVTCYVDDVKVDCKTWGDPVAKEEADEIESQLDFLSQYDS